MAPLAQPSPGLYAEVLHILSNTDSHSRSMATTMADLVEHLNAEEAECLPTAIGGVMPLLRRDPERLRSAAEIIARFDLFEAAGQLADLALGIGDRELLLAAATVCGNPAVKAHILNLVKSQVADDPAGLIRLDPGASPKTQDEECLYWQRWPGARTDNSRFALAPVVVLDSGLAADAVLRMAILLDKAGASVRRLYIEAEIPSWFGPQTVLVCRPSTRNRVLDRFPRFPVSQILLDDIPADGRGMAKLLRQIDAALPGPEKLWLTRLGPELE